MAMSPRLLRPRATGFDPRSIANLYGWWDASDASTMTLVSGVVSQWNDKSGGGIHATQTTANNRPSNSTETRNGRAVMTFDGSNDVMEFTGVARTDETWFVVARANAAAATTKTHIVLGSTSNHGVVLVAKNDTLASTIFGYMGGFTTGTTALRWDVATGNIPWVLVSVVRSAAAGGILFENGTQRHTATTSSSATISRIGAPGTGTDATCAVAEALIYSRPLSASERQRVERYLGRKWGLTVA